MGDTSIDDFAEFLEQPIVSTLATLRKDGSVLLSPVWHEWRDGGFNVCTARDDVKIRHIRRDPRVTLVVPEQGFPHRGVEIRCEARVIEEGGPETARRIAIRYEGEPAGGEWADKYTTDHVIVRLEPGELRLWDYAAEG